jgi:hypothetical protein
MQVLQAVLSGNLYGAFQDVGGVPTDGIDCTSGVCQINPLMDVGPAANGNLQLKIANAQGTCLSHVQRLTQKS